MALPWARLQPSLANAFLCHYEKLWLDSCPLEFKPVVYRRYVDDIFVLFKSKDHSFDWVVYKLMLLTIYPSTNLFRKELLVWINSNFRSVTVQRVLKNLCKLKYRHFFQTHPNDTAYDTLQLKTTLSERTHQFQFQQLSKYQLYPLLFPERSLIYF